MYTSNVVIMGVTGEVVLPFENVPSTAFSRGKAYEQVVETVEDLYRGSDPEKFEFFEDVASRTKIIY